MKILKKSTYTIIILILFVIQAYPVLWLIISSFRGNIDLSIKPFSFPTSLTLDNYINVIAKSNVFLYMKNSTVVTTISLIIIVIFSSMASFAISKFNFKWSNKVYSYFLIGLTIPYAVTLIPLFVMYTHIHLIDTLFGLMLPLIAFSLPVSVLLFVNFYRFVPNEIIEAAIIDGCSIYQVYFKIMMPLSLNTILTVLSMNFIFVWNDYIFSLIFINSTNMKTISLGLQDFIGSHGLTDWGGTFASICVTTLPTLIIYFALNKKVASGMTLGAIK